MNSMRSAKAPTPMDVHIGQRIVERRKKLGVSQENLAKSLGVTFQQIQKYERGMNRIGAGRLYEIALALQVHPGWFFEGAGLLDPESASSGKPERGCSQAALDNAFAKVKDARLRRRVIDFVQSLSD